MKYQNERPIQVVVRHPGYGCGGAGCGGSGCMTFFVVMLALGLMIEAWQAASVGVRFVLIFGTIAAVSFGIYGWERYTRKPSH
jgi:hypothetical protein